MSYTKGKNFLKGKFNRNNLTDYRHPNTTNGGKFDRQMVEQEIEIETPEVKDRRGRIISRSSKVKRRIRKVIFHHRVLS